MKESPDFTRSDKDTSRKRRYMLATIAFLVLTLTAIQIFLHQTSVGSKKFVSASFVLWAATALIVLALLILATILGRNLIKLYFERKSDQVGSRFKTKMVRIFMGLSLLPAVLLFSLAYTLVKGSIEQWFSAPGARLQEDSKAIAQQYYTEASDRARGFAAGIAERIQGHGMLQLPLQAELEQTLAEYRRICRIDDIRVYDPQGELAAESGVRAPATEHKEELAKLVAAALRGQADFQVLRVEPNSALQEMHWATAVIRNQGGAVIGAVVTETRIPNSVNFKAISVMEDVDAYNRLQSQESALRFNYLLILALFTLLIVFAFSWFAMYLAKRITVPIQALAEGSAAVADGNLDYRVQCVAFDELEDLVTSFNRMTAELKENKENIEAAQNSLSQTNVALDDRRRYIETILQAIATGVVSLDADYRIRTMNRAAIQMLGMDEQSSGFPLEDVVKGAAYKTLRALLRKSSVLGPVLRNIEIDLQGRTLHVAATVTPLVDSSEQRTGWVIVLDDLTELLRAEKMAAWQEVARRLAHEIKNPLTPIQLSAERMLHRYRQISLPARVAGAQEKAGSDPLAAFDRLLEECVQTIIREADALKNLVDEFSSFARLPEVRLEDADLHRVLESALSLYNGRIQDIRVERIFDPALPVMRLDAGQMKRVFINLFDNALEAMSDNTRPKVLRIRTSHNTQQHAARVEISDTGRGFPTEYQDSLFLPYFSTRRGGTGLGLAIVRQVVSDHQGQVRAEPNVPLGTTIVIDLPLASS
jgi:two-component system, NtrC family, nitrogen regulation sensor histidine kinase NtrY